MVVLYFQLWMAAAAVVVVVLHYRLWMAAEAAAVAATSQAAVAQSCGQVVVGGGRAASS